MLQDQSLRKMHSERNTIKQGFSFVGYIDSFRHSSISSPQPLKHALYIFGNNLTDLDFPIFHSLFGYSAALVNHGKLKLSDDFIRAINCAREDLSAANRGGIHSEYFIGYLEHCLYSKEITAEQVNYLSHFLDKMDDIWPLNAVAPIIEKCAKNTNNQLLSELMEKLKHSIKVNPVSNLNLPFCDEQTIHFKESVFCITGNCSSMKRSKLTQDLTALGARVTNNITRNTDYLLVGKKGSSHWKLKGAGNKILKALRYNSDGCEIRIITETHYFSSQRAINSIEVA